MGKNITVEGNTVYLNGEAVAQALGDFSPYTLAYVISLDPTLPDHFGASRLSHDSIGGDKQRAAMVCGGGGGDPTTSGPATGGPQIRSTVCFVDGVQVWPPAAPAELVEKARQYVPDQMGLLRLYADKRGFSCAQVDAAVAYVKGL